MVFCDHLVFARSLFQFLLSLKDLLSENIAYFVRHIFLLSLARIGLVQLEPKELYLLFLYGLSLRQLSLFVPNLLHHVLKLVKFLPQGMVH